MAPRIPVRPHAVATTRIEITTTVDDSHTAALQI
jgi:hypothetical protein